MADATTPRRDWPLSLRPADTCPTCRRRTWCAISFVTGERGCFVCWRRGYFRRLRERERQAAA